MNEIILKKSVQKCLRKAPRYIQAKFIRFSDHLIHSGMNNIPFPVKRMEGKYRKDKYYEAILDKDFRIIFRQEDEVFVLQKAGTHNQLHTG